VLVDGDDRDEARRWSKSRRARPGASSRSSAATARTTRSTRSIMRPVGRSRSRGDAQLLTMPPLVGALRRALRHHLRLLRRCGNSTGHPRAGKKAIEKCLATRLGAVTWQDRTLIDPVGMEIDLGGIGKEYAVVGTAGHLAAQTTKSFLVNFRARSLAGGLRRGNRTWASALTIQRAPARRPSTGWTSPAPAWRRAATPGCVQWRGKRLGHILNPKTGGPSPARRARDGLVAPTCLEGGRSRPWPISGREPGLFWSSKTSSLDSVSRAAGPGPFFRIPKAGQPPRTVPEGPR